MSKNKKKKVKEEIEVKLILLGDQGVGKTNLINIVTRKGFNINEESTSSASFSILKLKVDDQNYRINLWDTIGQEKFRSLTKIFIKDSKIVLLVYDITRLNSFKELDFWYKMIRDILGDDTIVGVCGNKQDLFTREQVKEETGRKYAEERNMPFKLTSAKNPLSFNKFLDELVGKYIEKFGGGKIKEDNGKINLNGDKKNDKKKCC